MRAVGGVEAGRARAVRALPFLSMTLVSLIFSSPVDDRWSGWPLESVGFALAAGACFQLAVALRLLVPAAVVALHVGAYSIGMSDAVRHGLELGGFRASADGVRLAIVAQVAFWLVLLSGTALFVRAVPGAWLRSGRDPAADAHERVGLGALLAVSLVAAFRTGTWTAYGGELDASVGEIGFKWEFFYDAALTSALLLAWHAILDAWEAERRPARIVWVLLGVLLTLAVFRQVRRLVVVTAVVGAVLTLDSRAGRERLLGRPGRVLAVSGVLALATVGLYVTSEVWRASAREFATNDVSTRVRDIYARGLDDPDVADTERARQRLTYLWLDALSFDLAPALEGVVGLDAIFTSSVAVTVPAYVFPSKFNYPPLTCESALAYVRLDSDLPCTGVAEGVLTGGWRGVVLVALSWTPFLALATVLLRRRRTLARVMGAHLMLPMTYVETQAFPFVGAVRYALLGTAFTLLFGLLWRYFRTGVVSRAAPLDPTRPLSS